MVEFYGAISMFMSYCIATSAYIHYNKVDFFWGSKLLKKALKVLKRYYFESLMDPWWSLKQIPSKRKFLLPSWPLNRNFNSQHNPQNKCFIFIKDWQLLKNSKGIKEQYPLFEGLPTLKIRFFLFFKKIKNKNPQPCA